MAYNQNDIQKIIDELQEIKERLTILENNKSNNKSTPKKVKVVSKSISFEEAYEQCCKINKEEGDYKTYPCFYIAKGGAKKGLACGLPAAYVDTENAEKVAIEKFGKLVPNLFYHSLRCPSCKDKGRSNSQSKRLCLEKIKGVVVENTVEVDKEVFSFLNGTVGEGYTSPTRAIDNAKSEPDGFKIMYDNHVHYLLEHNDNKYIFEYAKNKNSTTNLKKTPTLRGRVSIDDYNEETYLENIKEAVEKETLENLKKERKFFFDGQIIELKKEIVVPKLLPESAPKEEPQSAPKEELSEDMVDEILKDINLDD